jgi:predicted ATPase/DNA-binding SARP family transcriptional activator
VGREPGWQTWGLDHVQFGLLGPLEVRDGSREIVVQRAKLRALLALLLLHRGRVVSAEWLADQLWIDRPPARPVPAVHNYVSILRRLLERSGDPGGRHLLRTRPAGYLLNVSCDQVDAGVFERLAADARDAAGDRRWAEAAQTCDRALALWRGPALSDVRHLDFAVAPAGRVEELRRAVEDLRFRARLALGEHAQLIGELQAAVRVEPLREQLWGHLMLALYRCGRQADALGAYHTLRRTLGEELGIEPGPELQRLEEAILLQKDEHDRTPHDAGHVAPGSSKSALLALPTGFVGREGALRDLSALLRRRDVRLVTLTGPGGTGKTRLASELVDTLAEEFSDGVWFVPLELLRDPERVPSAIAQAVGVPAARQPPLEAVAQRLRGQRGLLVLDNFEHLRAASTVVAELVARCPRATLLVTSRVPLRVAGEHRYQVPPLRLPEPAELADLEALARCDAVALFCQRAASADPAFTLSEHNAAAVAAVCARVDGLPLAIELAAARIRVLSPQELLARLGQPLALLTDRGPDRPARHRTLRATIEWSYRLLPASEQALFRRLSVFSGGWTVAAAEAVAGEGGHDILDGTAGLLDGSLLWREQSAEGQSRFHMLETIREYARELLDLDGTAEEQRERHARYHVALAERACEQLYGHDEDVALPELHRTHDDILAALEWLLEDGDPARRDDGALALRLVAAMSLYWYTYGHTRLHGGPTQGTGACPGSDERSVAPA